MVRNYSNNIKNLCKRVSAVLISALLLLFICSNGITTSAETYNNKSSAIVIEAESGRVLSGFNHNVRLPMASTTKVVTALVVLDNMDINKVITIHSKAANVEGSSIYLKAGDKWKVIDLLYGLMLRSGNDAATALAYACGGSVEGFANMMNNKAISLGLTNSHFTNPHGLDDPEHYTSAYDLAMLTREAMKNETFRKIVSSKSYQYTGPDNTRCLFVNKNKMLNSFSGANGVKTGFTKKSGRCLVSSAKRNDMQLITVTINCNNMWIDSMQMMNDAFNKYSMYEVLREGELIGETRVTNSMRRTTMLASDSTIRYPLTVDEISRLYYQTDYKILKAPVKCNELGGKIEIYLDKQLIFTANAYTIEEINELGVRDHLRNIIDKWKMNYEN